MGTHISKEKIAQIAQQILDWEVERVYEPDPLRGGHPQIYMIETPKRWYYFYYSEGTPRTAAIIGNELDGIDQTWQERLQVDRQGNLLFTSHTPKTVRGKSPQQLTTPLEHELYHLARIEEITNEEYLRRKIIEGDQLGFVVEEGHITQLAGYLTGRFYSDPVQLQPVLKALGKFPYLTDLRIYNYQLDVLPDSLWKLTALENLILEGYEVREIPEEIALLSNLKHLTIKFDDLIRITPKIGELAALESLILQGKRLQEVPATMAQLSNLETLHITKSALQEVPEWIVTLPRLHTLDLSKNRIRSISEELLKIESLGFLNLSENPLKEVPSSFYRSHPFLRIFI